MDNFDLRKYLAEGRLLKKQIMVDPIIMFGGNDYIKDVLTSPDDFGFNKDDAEWVKNNILTAPKRVSIQDYMDLDDKWVKQAQIDTSGGGALDHVVDGLKIHVKQELITPEQEKEAMKVVGLSEGKLLKEEIMVDTTVMVDPNNTLMSNASDEEIDYIKDNITSVPKMPVEDFIDIYDKYLDRFYDGADPLDLQIKALQIHIDKGALTREEAIEALAMLQGQDVEEFEDEFLDVQDILDNNIRDYWSEWAAGEVEVGNDGIIDAGGVDADFEKVSDEAMGVFEDYVKAVKALKANSKELRNDIAGAVSTIRYDGGDFEDYEFDVLTAKDFATIQDII